ncbi:hypothetical protein BGZ76_002972 [Entomortierella beljakovae]|nr:hypothetical protein BGZ76_002972 [Entomortierella beljakovae]
MAVTTASPMQYTLSSVNDNPLITINGNLEVTGTISSNSINTSGDISSTGSVKSSGDISSLGSITTSGSINSGSIISSGTIDALSNITTEGTISSAGDIDSDGSINAGGNIVSYGNIITAQNVLSFGSVISTGRMTTHENLWIKKKNTLGESCSVVGLIGVDKTGQILSCRDDEQWHKPLANPATKTRETTQRGYRFPTAIVLCEPWEHVTGGGGGCDQPSGFIWIKHSKPLSNGWSVECDGGMKDEWGTASAYAICSSG